MTKKRIVAPSRVRELKHILLLIFQPYPVAPSRVRELKHSRTEFNFCIFVAPSRVRELKHIARNLYPNIKASHPHGCVN